MPAAIAIEGLSKAYRIGLKEEMPDTLIGAATSWVKAPLANFHRLRRLNTFHSDDEDDDLVWALKDVSFEVEQGEVVGIIGRNGAGKSTLLKILSRITEPTSGRAVIRGRVSSLLEVGTGFHPELSGRENIYMNGTILGMTKREIDRKFDEIVDFSGIEKFLDTPVKRYSSGMTVRLAFSVAAHLEPEILIVDEVLAVGDIEFQAKCLGKMQDVATGGRTVLFVSHNMGAMRTLCTRGVVLQNGTVLTTGSIHAAIQQYSTAVRGNGNSSAVRRELQPGQAAALTSCVLIQKDNMPTETAVAGEPLRIRFEYELNSDVRRLDVVFTIFNAEEVALTNCQTQLRGASVSFPPRNGVLECQIPQLPLLPGQYRIAAALQSEGQNLDLVPCALTFQVESSVLFEGGRIPNRSYAMFMIDHAWSDCANSQ